MLESMNTIHKIVELGCSNGWRLNNFYKKFNGVNCFGVDASIKAIENGKKRYPHITFFHGLLSQIPLEEEFDLVIVSFVLHSLVSV